MSMMNIDLRSLRHIVVLGRILNYTRAAEELGLTQSALSRSIQAFESNHQVKLFDRSRSGVRLTAVGRSVIERASQLLRDSEELKRQLHMTSQAQSGDIRYGMAPLSAKALMTSTLLQLLGEAPQLQTAVSVRNAEALAELLAKDDIEFFICSEGQIPDEAALRGVHIGWFSFSLLARPGHPVLSRSEPASTHYPVLIGDRLKGDSNRRLSKIPWLSGPQHVIEDYSAAARITERTDAIWVTSVQAAVDEICAGKLVELPLGTKGIPPRFRMMMYSLNRRTLSPGAVRLQALFQSQILSLSERLKKTRKHSPA